jgi:hypothetical protein
MNALKKAEREIAKGNLWRTREILERYVTHPGYKAEAYEKLGEVLLEMKDTCEAGKYLFLSGIRKPEYENAIELFLQRYEDKLYSLMRSFPRAIQLKNISEYPDAVAAKFREMRLPEVLKNEEGNKTFSNPLTVRGKLVSLGCISSLLVVILLLILGIVKLVQIISGYYA